MPATPSSRAHLVPHSALRQLAADSGFEFFLIITGSGALSSVSERLLRSTSHSPEGLRGKPFSTLVRKPDGRLFGPSFLNPRSATNPQRRKFSIMTRDGRLFECRGKLYYFEGARQEAGGALLLGTRIRTKSPAGNDLLSDRSGAALVARSLRDGLCIVDARGTIVSADAILAGMAGRHPADMIGVVPPYPWFGNPQNERLTDALGRVGKTGIPAHLLVVLERREDRPLALSFAISPLRERDGLFLVSVRDISDVHPVHESEMAERRIERLRQQVRRNADRLRTLADVNRSVLRSGSLTDVFRRITAGVGRLVDHDLAGIYIFDGDDQFLRPHTLSRLTTFSRRLGKLPLTPGQGIIGSAAITGETVMVNDAQHDPRSVYPPDMRPEIEHIIAAPLCGRQATYGILTVARNRHPGFQEEDSQIVQSFADAASIAIDNVILHAEALHPPGEPGRKPKAFRPPLVTNSGRRVTEPGPASPSAPVAAQSVPVAGPSGGSGTAARPSSAGGRAEASDNEA